MARSTCNSLPGGLRLAMAAGLLILLAPLAQRADAQTAANTRHGGEVFATECGDCHSLREGKDKKGPSLFGVFGAAAAQRPGFAYSDAMRASGLHWTKEQLDAYIANPLRVVPGGKMKYDGLAAAADRADLVAYLAGVAGK